MGVAVRLMYQVGIVAVGNNGAAGDGLVENALVSRGRLFHLRPLGARNGPISYVRVHWRFSETCATAGAAQTADIASAHSPAKTPHIFLFMRFDPPTKLVEAVVATTNKVQAVAHAHSMPSVPLLPLTPIPIQNLRNA